MLIKLTLGATALAAAAFFTPLSAAPIASQPITVEEGVLQQVHWRGRRCRSWRRRCAYRWGRGTWRYRRCLRRHSCGRWR